MDKYDLRNKKTEKNGYKEVLKYGLIFVLSGLCNITLLSIFTGISVGELIAKNEVLAVLVVAIPVAIVYILDLKNKSESRLVEDTGTLMQMQSTVKERYEGLVNDLNKSITIANDGEEIFTSGKDNIEEKRYDLLKSFRYFDKEIDNIIEIETKLNKFNSQDLYSSVIDPERFINMFSKLTPKAWSKADDIKYIGIAIPKMFEHYEKFRMKSVENKKNIKKENLQVLDLLNYYYNIDFRNDIINFFTADSEVAINLEGKRFEKCQITVSNIDDLKEIVRNIEEQADNSNKDDEENEQIMIINDKVFKNIIFHNCDIYINGEKNLKSVEEMGNKFHIPEDAHLNLFTDNLRKAESNHITENENSSNKSIEIEKNFEIISEEVYNSKENAKIKEEEIQSQDDINIEELNINNKENLKSENSRGNNIEVKNEDLNIFDKSIFDSRKVHDEGLVLYKDIRENIDLDKYNVEVYEFTLDKSKVGDKASQIKSYFKEIFEKHNAINLDKLETLYSRDYSDMPTLKIEVEFSGWHSFFADEKKIQDTNYLFIVAKGSMESNITHYYCIYFDSKEMKKFIEAKNISKTNKYNFYFSKILS